MIIRSMFFTIGMFVLLWGVLFVFTDRVLIHSDFASFNQFPLWSMISTTTADNMHEVSPPDWASFGMMTIGSLTMLYSISLPKKQA